MKFIVDAQLPKSLSDFLRTKGMDSLHTLDLPNRNKSKDFEIIELAEKENRIVITKDSDFLDSYIVNSRPKRLLVVSTGNIANSELLKIFDENFKVLSEALTKSGLVEISAAKIIEHGKSP